MVSFRRTLGGARGSEAGLEFGGTRRRVGEDRDAAIAGRHRLRGVDRETLPGTGQPAAGASRHAPPPAAPSRAGCAQFSADQGRVAVCAGNASACTGMRHCAGVWATSSRPHATGLPSGCRKTTFRCSHPTDRHSFQQANASWGTVAPQSRSSSSLSSGLNARNRERTHEPDRIQPACSAESRRARSKTSLSGLASRCLSPSRAR